MMSFQQAEKQFEYGWSQYVSGTEGITLYNSMKQFAKASGLTEIYFNPMHCIKIFIDKQFDQNNIKKCFLVAYELSKYSKLGFNHHVIKLIINRGSSISLNIKPSIETIKQFRDDFELVQDDSGIEYNPELFFDDALTDIDNADKKGEFSTLSETERESLKKSRIGQGRFRDNLLEYWGRKCAVTGFDVEPLLIASHIQPWRCCNNDERLDKFNGLLLTPGLDSAFDRGFITFLDDGTIVISDKLRKQDYGYLGINENQKLLKVQSEHIKYLEYHQDKVFEKW